ncbi:MAG: dihydroneopterin aldolase [Chthoniobacterales bacterium]
MSDSPEDAGDIIRIEELELSVRVGVPEEERAEPQRLTVSITLWPVRSFREMEDQLEQTVNYAEVCRAVETFAGARRDQLIETLADEMAAHLLENFSIRKLRLEVRKFILPKVNYVAVSVTREK